MIIVFLSRPIPTDGPFFGQNVDTRLEAAEIILFFCG